MDDSDSSDISFCTDQKGIRKNAGRAGKAAEKAASANPFAAADNKEQAQQADAQNVDQNQFFNQNGDIPLENIYGDSGLSLSTHKDGGEKAANGKGDVQADAAGDKNNSNPLARFFGAGKASAGGKGTTVKTGDGVNVPKQAGVLKNGQPQVGQTGTNPIIKNNNTFSSFFIIELIKLSVPLILNTYFFVRSEI